MTVSSSLASSPQHQATHGELVVESDSGQVNLLWIVAPVCATVVIGLLLALVVVIARYCSHGDFGEHFMLRKRVRIASSENRAV